MSASTGRRVRQLPTLLQNSATRYLIAGGLAFIVDFGLLALFHEVFGWVTWIAAGTAFLVSFFFTYAIQRVFSFGSTAPHGNALIKYTLLVAFNTLATAIIVGLVDQSALSWAGGKIIATALTTTWNYFVYKYWVFASSSPVKVDSQPGED